jgi:hypothetical protein
MPGGPFNGFMSQLGVLLLGFAVKEAYKLYMDWFHDEGATTDDAADGGGATPRWGFQVSTWKVAVVVLDDDASGPAAPRRRPGPPGAGHMGSKALAKMVAWGWEFHLCHEYPFPAAHVS